MMVRVKTAVTLGMVISALTLSGCLSGGGGGSSSAPGPAPSDPVTEQQKRIQDGFFVIDETQLPFDAAPAHANTSRWHGVLDGAGYRVEVPENWNGMLVMYAHGYRGETPDLTVDNPPMRDYLLREGYAWAASSYSSNFYDVRAGVEDTNALALAFNDIAEQNGRSLQTPTKYYITGVSMGGHVAGAAIERETEETARNFVPYAGAAPMCGVMGDSELFNYFAAYNLAMFEFGGVPADSFPVTDVEQKLTAAREALWVDYETDANVTGLTPAGLGLYATLQNLSGGPRPIYPLAFGGFQGLLQGLAGDDGTITGVLAEPVIDTTDITYRFQTQPGQPLNAVEEGFNNRIAQAVPANNANPIREDGVRLIPKVNGDLYADIPVVTIHTLGDLFVPIKMQQIYRQRMEENGWGDNLVQRAVRAPAHCDFSLAEFNATLEAMLQWEQTGAKPGGDNLMDPAVMADDDFGCTYTIDGPPQAIRAFMPPCSATSAL